MIISSTQKRRLAELKNPAMRMTRLLSEKAMAEAVGKMEMMKGDSPTPDEILALIEPLLPTEEYLKSLIKPLIPDPIKGDNYVLTNGDKEEIAGKVDVPVVEKIIERVEVPIVTEQIIKEIKEVALDESADKIRDKLESLKKGSKQSIQSIEDLPDILAEIRKWRGEVSTFMSMGGGGGFTSPVYNFIDDETPAGTVDGSNAVFVLARLPYRGSVKVYVNGQRMKVTSDYTLSADQKTITFLIAPPTTSVVLVDYRTI